MSWLEKLLPPKIQHTDPSDRRSVPEGVWVKCPSCETVLYKSDLEQNQNVIPFSWLEEGLILLFFVC
jgi:acetyl-CoA carboxylase carboxyl transferase subunit beta